MDLNNNYYYNSFLDLSTPYIADACLKLEIPLRIAPTGIKSLISQHHIAGRVLPVKQCGSVDIFLEAMAHSESGDILVIDNEKRMDEGCVGDLTVLEAVSCELAGVIVWGCHRDSAELLELNLPVFTYGSYPAGPRRLDPRDPNAMIAIQFGESTVTRNDIVFADIDGVIFVSQEYCGEVINTAKSIWQTERKQAENLVAGQTLYIQLKYDEYIHKRSKDPKYTFRQHLKDIDGAIEV